MKKVFTLSIVSFLFYSCNCSDCTQYINGVPKKTINVCSKEEVDKLTSSSTEYWECK